MKRDEILEAAAQIISEKGFHATSMQDIANAVDLQKASLYHHVSNKQEILVALLDRALDMLIEGLEQATRPHSSAADKLGTALAFYLSALVEHRDLAAVLLLEHRSLEPEFRARHIPRRDRFEGMWRTILEEGVAGGEFVIPDVRMTAKMVLGVANWTIMWYQPGGPLKVNEIAALTTQLLLNGMMQGSLAVEK